MPEFHVIVESDGLLATDLLADASGLSKGRIKEAMTKGALWLTRGSNTRRLRRAKRALRTGDELYLYYDEQVLAEEPAEPTLVADVGGYSVWDKPYGLRSQGSKWGDHCTITRWAERHLDPERPALTVHRLDRAATGLILVAHSKSVAAALSSLFQQRAVEKHYAVKVHGEFPDEPNGLRVETPIDGKEAASIIRRVVSDDGVSTLDVQIETGRKHQIRWHLAELGFPVIGDRLYGRSESDAEDLQLRAVSLSFHCPVQDKAVCYTLDG